MARKFKFLILSVIVTLFCLFALPGKIAFADCQYQTSSADDDVVICNMTPQDPDGVFTDRGNDTVWVEYGALVHSNHITLNMGFGNDTVYQYGKVTSNYDAIDMGGGDDLVHQFGIIEAGDDGIWCAPAHGQTCTIYNYWDASIHAGAEGIDTWGEGGNARIVNYGVIRSDGQEAVHIHGTGHYIVYNYGTFSADRTGFEVADGTTYLENHGMIHSDKQKAIETWNLNDTILNYGTAHAVRDPAIDSGDGNDLVDNQGHAITKNNNDPALLEDSVIYTRDGNDTVIVGPNASVIELGVGYATIAMGHGSDTTIIQGGEVRGLISGDNHMGLRTGDFDTLRFELTGYDEEIDAFQAELANQTPQSGTVMWKGRPYTWIGYEQIQTVFTRTGTAPTATPTEPPTETPLPSNTPTETAIPPTATPMLAGPALDGPANGAQVGRQPIFVWYPVWGAAQYRINIATDPEFTNIISNQPVDGLSYQRTSLFTIGQTYYWRVRATNSNGTAGPYSEVWSFLVTDTAPTPTITNTPTITPTPTNTLIPTITPTPSNTPEPTLIPTETSTPTITPTWTSTPTLQPTLTPTPGLVGPHLNSPLEGEVTSRTPSFSWAPVFGAAQYRIYIATDPDFINVISNQPTTQPSFTAESALAFNTTYYWRVRATAANGSVGPYSDINWFTVVAATATPTMTPSNTPSPTPESPTFEVGYYEQTRTQFIYSGTWATISASGASGGSYRQTKDSAGRVTFAFRGNKLTIFRTMKSDRAAMQVCIDGACQLVQNYSSTTKYKQPIVFTVLDGMAIHNVTITKDAAASATAFFDIDAINVEHLTTPTPAPTIAPPTETPTPVTAQPLFDGFYQESSTDLIYTGTWATGANNGASGGQYRYTNDISATVSFTFEGKKLTIFRTLAYNRGAMEICIDGTCETVQSYHPTVLWQQPVSFMLDLGFHTVEIRNHAGSFIDLDAILIEANPVLTATPTPTDTPTYTPTPTETPTSTPTNTPNPILQPGRYEDNYGTIYYTGGTWNIGFTSRASGGSYMYLNSKMATVTFQFYGDRVTIYRRMDPNRADVNVCIDGVCQIINNNSSSDLWQQPISFNVPLGVHTFEMKNIVTKTLDLDAVLIEALTMPTTAPTETPTDVPTEAPTSTPTDAPTVTLEPTSTSPASTVLEAGLHEQDHAGLIYSGTWATYTDTSASGGSYTLTDEATSTVNFQFNGSKLTLFRTIAVNRGAMQVCIDGTCQTVQNFSQTTVWQAPVSFIVQEGVHTVEISNASTTFIDLDAVRVEVETAPTVTPPPLPTNTSEPTATNTNEPLPTNTVAPTNTAAPTNTVAPTSTSTATPLPTNTVAPTATKTVTPQPTATQTNTPVPTNTAAPTATKTPTVAPTNTPSGTVLGTGNYEQEQPGITYTGNWQLLNDAGASGGSFRRTNDPNAQATFQFNGNRLTLITLKFSNRGSMEVCIDTTNCSTVNMYSPSLIWQVPLTFNVASGTHTVRIRNLSSSYIDVDAVQVATTTATNTPMPTNTPSGPSLGAGSYQQDQAMITYTGNWQLINDAGASGGSFRRTNDPSAQATFQFTGSKLTLISLKFSNRGSMEICIDTTNCSTVNMYSTQLIWQVPLTFNVSSGTHTVRIRNLSGSYIDIDAVTIE